MTTTDSPATTPAAAGVDAFAERVFQATLGAMETLSIHAGDRLGWYRALADDGPASAEQLAARTGTNERYTREWLEQQAVLDILTTDPDAPAADRVYMLPPDAR